ncbi:hypothetical protein LVD15_18280 [Fulvivirga maritima]|uniref:hypothetical protein n=1 Tax=Fulvivirga maritima TaxID=2904247 RepID=UPI001F317EE5|nr:hypothetical protein [Fulvivirga maritima]UII25242.1 hypothetical protein LVD15_18280 [Fulvivirga maritima]
MIEEFKNLNSEEAELMYKAPLLVSILIAGADEEIDKAELNEAVSLSKLKKITAREDLDEYYEVVSSDFEEKVEALIHQYPEKVEQRNKEIITELEKLNDILPKLDKKFALEFYESIKDMAKKIAESSGGILGYMAVGYEESKLIKLPMIKDPAQY